MNEIHHHKGVIASYTANGKNADDPFFSTDLFSWLFFNVSKPLTTKERDDDTYDPSYDYKTFKNFLHNNAPPSKVYIQALNPPKC